MGIKVALDDFCTVTPILRTLSGSHSHIEIDQNSLTEGI
jgi:hypothetical protein